MDGTAWPSTYEAEYAASLEDPQGYWMAQSRVLEWVRPPQAGFVLRPDGQAGWFPGGMLNLCANALDRHVAAGRGEQAALIWESPASGASDMFTYAALLARVAGFAGGLRAAGVEPGDRVVICLPPIPECFVAMLACARLGAVHVVVFAGFAPAELARRIEDVDPKLVITASATYRAGCATPLLPGVREATQRKLVVVQRPGAPALLGPAESDFATLEYAEPIVPVPMPATAPLYILHTSGTTGRPKGVVRDTGGHGVVLAQSMRTVYGLGAGEVFFTTADPGWVVGHSYGLYAPLLAGCATVLAEGAVGRAVWDICERHRVAVLFTSPSVLRALRLAKAAPPPLPPLRRIFLAGERADAGDSAWAAHATGVKVLDHWWQTETGSAMAGSFAGLGDYAAPGSSLRPAPGYELCALDVQGQELPPGHAGEIAVRLPLPPGCLTGMWGATPTCFSYSGYYRSFDYGVIAPDRGVSILSRTDEVLNIAGRRLGAGEIEAAIADHPGVMACAVIAAPHRLRGEEPVGFVVPHPEAGAKLQPEIIALVRERLGAFVGLRRIVLVEELPRTKSGKIIRQALSVQVVFG